MRNESTIGLSAPSLYPLPGFVLQPLSIECWEGVTKFLGYEKLEWTPMRSKVDQQISSGVNPARLAILGSAEQSFRSEVSLKQSWDHTNRVFALAAYGLFPHRTQSLRNLLQLQQLSSEIPMTVYAAISEEEETLHAQLQNKLVQPSPDIVEHWGIKSFEDMLRQLDERGYGINLDPIHYFRMSDYFNLPKDRDAIALMGDRIKELQFSANRFDFGKPNGTDIEKRVYVATIQAFRDVQSGTRDSEHTKLFLESLESGFKGPIVSEVKCSAINPVQMVVAHKRIAAQLKRWRDGR